MGLTDFIAPKGAEDVVPSTTSPPTPAGTATATVTTSEATKLLDMPTSADLTKSTAATSVHSITFDDITYTLPLPDNSEKTILRGISGEIGGGRLTALMGSSGAGKTTLMNVLQARGTAHGVVGGDIYLNGRRLAGQELRRSVAYVTQADVLADDLTTRENIMYAAHFSCGADVSHAEKKRRTAHLLRELGLRGCADTRVGSADGLTGRLSGGQRKRVNIARSLVMQPQVLFMDEPTSGA
jgi:ABC-type multidrug transport system ATPase subunit